MSGDTAHGEGREGRITADLLGTDALTGTVRADDVDYVVRTVLKFAAYHPVSGSLTPDGGLREGLSELVAEYRRTCDPAPYTSERALIERVENLLATPYD